MSEDTYIAYKMAKNLIEKSENCCEKKHCDDPLFKEWEEAIRIFDSLNRGYAERYEKEKNDELFSVVETSKE